MNQIWQRLWVGGHTDSERLIKGNPNHIDSVISLFEGCVTSKLPGVNYIHIPIEDDCPIPIGKFDAVIDAITENIRWGTVLIHCGVGLSRAPSLAAAYLDVVGYKDIDAAIEEIRQLRPIINPSKILVRSIKEILE